MGRRFAYVRVSTREQNTDRQTAELRQYVDNEQCIIIDKASGKDFNRPNYSGIAATEHGRRHNLYQEPRPTGT